MAEIINKKYALLFFKIIISINKITREINARINSKIGFLFLDILFQIPTSINKKAEMIIE